MDLEFPGSGERRGPSMRPPSRTQTRIALVVVAVVVGFLVGVRVAQRNEQSDRLAAESPQDLTRILADLNAEADQLSRQVSDLRLKVFEYRDVGRRDELALEDARKALADLQVLSGETPVAGEGLTLTIVDPGAHVTWDAFLDLVQELRDAGAEAIAVNGARVVAATWFGPGETGLAIDGEAIPAPYVIEAIGSGVALREALGIPGGPLALLQAQPQVEVRLEEARRLRLPAARAPTSFRYAQPLE